jgi:transposase InsO family protein
MLELVRQRPRFGYRRIGRLLQAEGWRTGLGRVFRLWRKEGLKVPHKQQKRRRLGVASNACDRRKATHINDVWCWDFIFDRTTNGSPIKWLTIIDEYTRECLALLPDRSITSQDVIDKLAELFAMRGMPKHIRSDNGPEFISKAIQEWLRPLNVETLYIEPGSPWQNGYAESFHSRFRDEFLRVEEFENIAAAKRLTSAWKEDYNQLRPHSSLDNQTPRQFAAGCVAFAPAAPTLQQHTRISSTPTFTQPLPS